MSGTRIKYKNHPYRENWLISCKSYVSTTTGAKYKILLDMNEKKFYIRNELSKKFIIRSNAYNNQIVFKRNIRKAIIKLGVVLHKEIRDRQYGICKKGEHTNNNKEDDNNK